MVKERDNIYTYLYFYVFSKQYFKICLSAKPSQARPAQAANDLSSFIW